MDEPKESEKHTDCSAKPADAAKCDAKIVQTFIVEREKENPERERRERIKLFWERFAGIGIGIYTLLTVGILAASWYQYSLNQTTMIANTRAWVVPTGAKFDGKLILNSNMRVKISFENVGKEAAWDVVDNRGEGPVFPVIIDGKGTPYTDVGTNPWPANTLCAVQPTGIANRRTVYPAAKNDDITYIFNPPGEPFVTQDFLDKKQSLTVVGCFVYRTPIEPDKIRHSPYCFYFQHRREGTADDGTFEFCPSGSANAD